MLRARNRVAICAIVVALALAGLASCGDDDGGGAGSAPADRPTSTTRRAPAAPGAGNRAPTTTVPIEPLTIFVSDELHPTLLRIVAVFGEIFPNVPFDIHHGPSSQLLARIQAGERPDLYFDSAAVVAFGGDLPGREPVPFADNPLVILTPPGNPLQLGLSAFSGDPATRSGVCDPSVPCGELAQHALSRAGITPSPDLVAPDGRTLADAVVRGEVDAALVLRTEARRVFRRASVARITEGDAVALRYVAVQMSSGPVVKGFREFATTSEPARRILGAAGLGPFAL